ncbi:PTS sugar transporter subunit IIA [Anaerostipes caccae]|uniref:PTS sugar transporter subunit IIA n=1 Tax=Anaerostipes caccae TaxID=105841 RepID=UPI00101CA01A|nr:PTS sugar transporter subunit IIA [Anaerostipes caccae]
MSKIDIQTVMPQIMGYQITGTERDDVLTEMADFLASMGMVKPTYAKAVIDRENIYPTGICTEPYPVAIPHCERDGVLKTAILVGQTRNNGITFQRIDDTDLNVDAKVIFMLAVDTNQGQLEVISKLMDVIQDEKVVEEIVHAKTCEKIKEIVTNAFING